MRSPTIRDVAHRAGVGIGTVSRVINNHPQVSPETRARVEEAIRALKFRPNRAARLLQRGTSHVSIGVLLPNLPYHPHIERLRGVQEALERETDSANLVLYNISAPDRLDDLITLIVSQHAIDGLIVIVVDLSAEQVSLIEDAGIRVVGIHDRAVENVPSLHIDNIIGGRIATDHLLSLGHRRIAYLGICSRRPMVSRPAPTAIRAIRTRSPPPGCRSTRAASNWANMARPKRANRPTNCWPCPIRPPRSLLCPIFKPSARSPPPANEDE